MNASRTDQPRTSPVAFLTKRARSSYAPAPAAVAMNLLLSAREHEALDLLAALEVDDGAEKLALLVRAPRVYAERSAEAGGAARLVNVAMQRERRLELLDRRAHGGRADRPRRAAGLLEAHVGRQLGRVVQLRSVRRAVEAEDRVLGR